MSENAMPNDSYHKRMALHYGSIISHVSDVAVARGFVNRHGGPNITKLARVSGISTATLYYLFKRPDTFRTLNLVTLAKLCKALDAQPGDLFSFVPGLTPTTLGIDTSVFASLRGTRGADLPPNHSDA